MNVELTLEELELMIDVLANDYARKVRKAQRIDGERSIKITKELGDHQALTQKIMMTYHAEVGDAVGLSES